MRKKQWLLTQVLRLSLKQLLAIFLSASLLIWLLSSVFLYFYDHCGGRTYTSMLCKLYAEGVVDGNLCSQLCHTHSLYIYSCLQSPSPSEYRIFLTNDTVFKVKESLFLQPSLSQYELAITYNYPRDGSNMEEFRIMVRSFLDHKLERGDHEVLLHSILNYADCNNDGKVSLAEAKSVWSLMQHNDFFVAFVFRDNEFIPNVRGSCGDLFGIEKVFQPKLYEESNSSFFRTVFPESYKWAFPSWNHRGRVALSLLEFAQDAYEHSTDAQFHMCNLSPSHIGYNEDYDIRLVSLKDVISKRELAIYFENTACQSDTDCVYASTCQGQCDKDSGLCLPNVVHPNLFYICRFLEAYLNPHVPVSIKGDLMNLYDRCSLLNTSTVNFELHHSLVLQDFKSVLWKEIADKHT